MMQSLTEEKFEAMRRAIDLVAYIVERLGVNPEEAISILSAVESSDYLSYDTWRDDIGETQEAEEDWYQEGVESTHKLSAPYVYHYPFTSPLSEDNLAPRRVRDSQKSLEAYNLVRLDRHQWQADWTGTRADFDLSRLPKSLERWKDLGWIVEFSDE